MGVLSSPEFWRRLDARIDRRAQRTARPVRGVVGLVTGSSLRLVGQILARAGEALIDVEVAQHFGFSSSAPPGTEVVAVPVGGSSGHQVIVAELDPVHRPIDLLPGEAVLYSTALAQVRVKADGSVLISTAAGQIQVTAAGVILLAGGGQPVARVGDTVTITGTDSVGGPITATGVIASGSSLVQAGG